MILRFYLRYNTNYGDDIQLKFTNAQGYEHTVQMNYLNNEYWEGQVSSDEAELPDMLAYQYVRRHYGEVAEVLQNNFSLNLKKIKNEVVEVLDEWRADHTFSKTFQTRPFEKLIKHEEKKANKKSDVKNATHLIKIKGTTLPEHLVYCLTGSGKKMNDWDETKPLFLDRTKKYWTAKLNLSKETLPIEFKVAVFDLSQDKIVGWEQGPNRRIEKFEDKHILHVYHILADFPEFRWKGAGINFPVSALKTKNSWGVGEFTDLFQVVDLCKATGLKLIQLLPVNDTTATHTNKDSYPYSAITAFALHPIYLNVQKLAKSFSVKFSPEILQKIDELNHKPTLHYEEILKIKTEAIKQLYAKEKDFFKDDFSWFEFFDLHRHWLMPYAAFCYLRDKNNTADFNEWGEYSVYDEEKIQELASPQSDHYDEIAIHYFTQYHLFLQLKDAVDYAHKNGVAMKADLPIGVGRHSVDTWMNPSLFHMDMQAGAPPDAFAVKGQNWGFPTYNWEVMAQDNYAWWRQRMEQLSNYADAVRIDHVLGFFRIWSIPLHCVEGILGRFIPAIPLYPNDFEYNGIHFNEFRLCAPFFTDDILYGKFGDKTDWVKNTFLNGNAFKPEFDTQRKIGKYFESNTENAWAKQSLFDILADVILIRDPFGGYHFRINIFETNSFKYLSAHERGQLDKLYNRYFFQMQDELWKHEGIKKLNALQSAANNMLLCAEDLGMVPEFVPGVLSDMEILTLSVERMPKKSTDHFSLPGSVNYDCVITPSTHDMSTIREWWEEDTSTTQQYFNEALGNYGGSPFYCEPWAAKDILRKHMQSPAMWGVFLVQDLLAISSKLRRENPLEERINVPANPDHYWNYRMHLNVEDILADKAYCDELKELVQQSGR